MIATHKYVLLVGVIALAAIFYFAAISTLVFRLQPPLTTGSNFFNRTPTLNIVLYEGEISGSRFGFGYSPNNLTSPGPTLRFTTWDVVNITVINVGKIPHAFAITDMPQTGATVLFNTEIGSASTPLQPGQRGSVIFVPNNAGSSFYYMCPIPRQAETGMYGSVVITANSGSGTGMGM